MDENKNKDSSENGLEKPERAKNWNPRSYYLADQNNNPLDLGEETDNSFENEDACKKWIKDCGKSEFPYYIAYKAVSVNPIRKTTKAILA